MISFIGENRLSITLQKTVCWFTDTFKSKAYLLCMPAKYYTQFRLRDGSDPGRNEFSGVVEVSRPMEHGSDMTQITEELARNFDFQQSALQLLSWSRLH